MASALTTSPPSSAGQREAEVGLAGGGRPDDRDQRWRGHRRRGPDGDVVGHPERGRRVQQLAAPVRARGGRGQHLPRGPAGGQQLGGQPGVQRGQRPRIGGPQRGGHPGVEIGGARVEMAGGALGVGGGAVAEHEQADRLRVAGELGGQRGAQCGAVGRARPGRATSSPRIRTRAPVAAAAQPAMSSGSASRGSTGAGRARRCRGRRPGRRRNRRTSRARPDRRCAGRRRSAPTATHCGAAPRPAGLRRRRRRPAARRSRPRRRWPAPAPAAAAPATPRRSSARVRG